MLWQMYFFQVIFDMKYNYFEFRDIKIPLKLL